MKLTFVDGVLTIRDVKTITDPFSSKEICGQYRHKWHCSFYEQKEDEIIVVKQRSKWFTLLILVHEYMHYLNRKMFKGKRKRNIDDWIDKYIRRKQDGGQIKWLNKE